jgi:tetratricopeptide (TPR) repeat protein
MLHVSSFMKTTILFLCPVATFLPAGIAAAATFVAQTRAENAARCGGDDLDIALTGCTALIQSGQETAAALAVIHLHRGIAYYNKGLTDQAIADETAVIALQPDFATAYYDRGEAYLNKGLTDQAIADYTKAIALKISLAYAYNNRGFNYEKKGEGDKAIADYRTALEFDPNDDWARDALHRLGVTP